MRRLLVERARARGAAKRGGAQVQVTLDERLLVDDARQHGDRSRRARSRADAAGASSIRSRRASSSCASSAGCRSKRRPRRSRSRRRRSSGTGRSRRPGCCASSREPTRRERAGPSPPDPEAWRRINDLFHRALDIAAGSAPAFLDGACAGDDAVARRSAVAARGAQRAPTSSSNSRRPTAADSPTRPPLGERVAPRAWDRSVGQYRIDRVLGEGGMGVVYLAEDPRLGRTVALKALSRRASPATPTRRERLRREARAAAALTPSGHRHGLRARRVRRAHVHRRRVRPGRDAARGARARTAQPSRAPSTPRCAIARALAAAHERGVVHRDLKPENVMRTPAGDVKILDFGLARMRDARADDARLTADGTLLGTPAYMSPEQIRGDRGGRAVGPLLARRHDVRARRRAASRSPASTRRRHSRGSSRPSRRG